MSSDQCVDTLSLYEMFAEDGAVHRMKNSGCDLVCNFEVLDIRSGQARYLGGSPRPVHKVQVRKNAGGTEWWKISSDIYDVKAWEQASPEALIVKKKDFRTYLHHRIAEEGIREEDPQVDRTYCTGLVTDRTGKVRVSDSVNFPGGVEDCLYHGQRFHDSGSKEVFEDLARLSEDDTVRAVLVYLLGAPLKAALDFYPHGMLVGDKECGKTTQTSEICNRLGLRKIDAPLQFQTPYRRKKTLANSNWPVIADEIGRVGDANFRKVIDNLNAAYRTSSSSHGAKGRQYALHTPLLMLGQDCPVRDEALLSKLVSFRPDPAGKNPDALKRLQGHDEMFPVREWLQFAAGYASQHDLRAECRDKQQELHKSLCASEITGTAESDRTIRNYATQLVVADALNEYGVDASVEGYTKERLEAHLQKLNREGGNVARSFILDLLDLLGGDDRDAQKACEWSDEGLYIHVKNAFNAVEKDSYDISNARRMTELLRDRGIAEKKPDRHRFHGVQLRCVFIRYETIEQLQQGLDS